MKRLFDFTLSLVGLLFFAPLFILLAVWIKFDSRGDIFYRQVRVGKDNKDFCIFKFRSMRPDSDQESLITVGECDPRITRSGYVIRKYKFDELPQLINVLIGDMSFVGPRPEVRRYVELYTLEQMKVLLVRPGITDMASIKYRNENELLATADDPEQYYQDVIMQDKLQINLDYLSKRSFCKDIMVIFETVFRVVS